MVATDVALGLVWHAGQSYLATDVPPTQSPSTLGCSIYCKIYFII